MADVPCFVEAVDVGAVVGGVAPLGGVRAHPHVSVREGKDGFRYPQVHAVRDALNESPRVNRIVFAVDGGLRVNPVVVSVGAGQ